MKGENEINTSNPANLTDTLEGFVSLPAVDSSAAVMMAIADMYAENLDDYGESLNNNAADITKDSRRIKK